MTDYDGLVSAGNVALEPEVLGGIFQSASEQSVVLGLGRKLRNMTTSEMKLKVSTALPLAYFVGTKGIPLVPRPSQQMLRSRLPRVSGMMFPSRLVN
jgi:hypothetical protein